jgi:peptidoglycan/LPS O-acetylase OafA/YrhL
LTANGGVNFFNGGAGAATTFTFLKGATYRIDAPFAVYVGASTVTAATTPTLLVSPTVVVTGGISYGLQAVNLPISVGSTGSTTAVPFSGNVSAVFTVGTGWGPAAGAAGYNPLTITAVITYKIVETALTTLALNFASGFGVSSGASYANIVITRIK